MDAANYYEDRANGKFLNKTNEKEKIKAKEQAEEVKKQETTQEKLKRTAKDVGMDVAIGVLGGGLGAAIFGPYSFVGGLVVSFYGNYIENSRIATLGLGMMSSSSKTAAEGVKQDPKAGMIENMQERVKAFGNELQRKVFLDKLLVDKKPDRGKEESNLKGVEEIKVEKKATTEVNPKAATKISNPFKVNEDTSELKKKNTDTSKDTDFNDISDRLY